MYLPSYRDVLVESFVSFSEPMTVDKEFLQQARRIVSLSEQGRRALYVQYVRWLTRWALAEIQCPACGVNFNPAVTTAYCKRLGDRWAAGDRNSLFEFLV